MPQSLGCKPVPVSDPHSNCLRQLGDTRVKDKYQICWDFRSCIKKDGDIRLKALLMEAALRPVSEPSHSDLEQSTSASV